MHYAEFRERISERFGRGALRQFASFVGMTREAVCKWHHPPGWVEPLLDAWDEIDRLQAMVTPPEAPIDFRTLPDPDKSLPPIKREEPHHVS